ncbi:MAG: hypothetical protein LUF29_05590 [Oscillospiraceae bacterium]|nr:hypothetical protein [Oscillospiraceae bacterium]
MSKKLLCVLLSVLMVLTLLPANAFAAVNNITYLYVGGTNILTRTDYKITYDTDSYAQFDATTNTLTLHNANITMGYASSMYTGIYLVSTSAVSGGITINLEGTNTITKSGTPATTWYAIRIQDSQSCPLTITSSDGTGTLAITNSYYGIYTNSTGGNTISNCTVTVDSITYYGLYTSSSLTISNANLTVNVTGTSTSSYGIYPYGSVCNITDGSVVNVYCAKSSAIYSSKTGTATVLTVTDSSLTCTVGGSKAAIYLASMNVAGDSTVIADGGINLFSTNSNYSSKGYSYLTVSPTNDPLEILVGASSSGTSTYGTYSSETTLTAPSALEYSTYAYLQISPSQSGGGSGSDGVFGLIYVNEDYHGLVITRNGRRFLISIPHDDANGDGICDTCHEQFSDGEETVETVTMDDVTYEVAYSYDKSISAGNWTQVELDDLGLIEALAEDGAILVITRDSATSTSFANGDYEKFLLIDSWWSNNNQTISLGTAGHTSADEDVIDCLSDDGTVAIYDGATIYAAWEAGNYAAGGDKLVFISNTSASYKIVSIQVLVPVD